MSLGRIHLTDFPPACKSIDILLNLLFLATGFGLGVVGSISVFANRIDRLSQREIAVPTPKVQVNVSAELVARYLESFDLIAIPKHMVSVTEAPATKH